MNTRRNPFAELERLLERMSRQFEESGRAWETDGPFSRWTTEFEAMAVDPIEQDDAFVVTVDLPGFEREEIKLEVTDHTLRIDAERESILDDEDAAYLRHERHHESMQRSLQLPDEVDKERVTATMNNGVLTITLPKLESETAQSIEIKYA